MEKNLISYENCLAKTERVESGQSIPGMTVFQHCVASGVTSSFIAEQFPYLRKIGLFPAGFQLVVALHDIGKVSPAFQYKLLASLSDDEKRRIERLIGLDSAYCPKKGSPAHMNVSYSALYERYGEYVAYIEGSHHGGYDKEPSESGNDECDGGELWQTSRLELADKLEEVFGSEVPCFCYEKSAAVKFLAGLTIVSDWLCSSVSLSEYEMEGNDIFRHKVAAAGFRSHKYRQGLSFFDVFGFSPRPEQQALIDAVVKPGVYILEAGTGSGKTEAALYAAYKMLSSGFAEGIYFALPTTFTSRQIHKRLDAFLCKIIDEEKISAQLVFRNSFLYSCIFEKNFNEPSWFDSRKRQILAPFAAGTVDQALMSVLRVRHSAVRSFGLAGKVVIIDEVHSYDTYTGNLIKRLIKELKDLGATVIVLSATLQQKSRSELIGFSQEHTLSSYPCVTSLVGSKYSEKSCEASYRRTVIIRHEENDSDAVDKAIEDAYAGKFVMWIENTVDDAQSVFRKISARCGNDVRTELIHSRFLGSDRMKKEALVSKLWGKDGWNERRNSTGFILVGTQILEQSLDIDADVLYTRLAPIDMLFQRMGRLWRHEHPERQGYPVCHIMHPSLERVIIDPDALRPSSYVYLAYILYRTLSAFSNTFSINIPEDIRPLLDTVYCDDSGEKEPVSAVAMRKELMLNRERLENLSNRAVGTAGELLSDMIMPRYSDLKTCRVMILHSVDINKKTVTLTDGEKLSLDSSLDSEQKALVSLRLEENTFTVPASRCPELMTVLDKAVKNMLSPFIYIPSCIDGKNSDECIGICIMLKNEGRQLYDLSKNILKNACYSQSTGYTYDI